MKILHVNNFQMRDQKRQNINFEAARFDHSSTAKYVNNYILPLTCINDAIRKAGIEVIEEEGSFYTTLSENEKIITKKLNPKDLAEGAIFITRKMIDDMLETYKELAGKKQIAELDLIEAKKSRKTKKAEIQDKRVVFQEAEKNFEQKRKEIIRKLEELIAPEAVKVDASKLRKKEFDNALPGVSESA